MADPLEDAELTNAYIDLIRLQTPKNVEKEDMVPQHLRRRRQHQTDNKDFGSAVRTCPIEQAEVGDNRGVEEPGVDEDLDVSDKVTLSSEAEDRENFHRWMWRRSGTLHSYIIGTFAVCSYVWAWRVRHESVAAAELCRHSPQREMQLCIRPVCAAGGACT